MSMPDVVKSARRRYRRLRAFMSAPRLQVQSTVVMQGSIEPCPNPIFVIGCHRSGTTLLRRILNAHPHIACPPETFFLFHFLDFLGESTSRTGLGSMVGEGQVDDAIRGAAFQFHEAFRVGEGKPRWADKTPSYLSRLPDLRRLAPEGTQYVAILRDPFDICYSIYNRNWFIERHSTDILENTLIFLRRALGELHAFVESGVPYVLRYEDMVSDPESRLRPLCDFLGEPWDDALLRPWEAQQNFGIEDPIARGSFAFNPSIGNWSSFTEEQLARCEAELGPIRRELGYS
jgi:hypothetical protein